MSDAEKTVAKRPRGAVKKAEEEGGGVAVVESRQGDVGVQSIGIGDVLEPGTANTIDSIDSDVAWTSPVWEGDVPPTVVGDGWPGNAPDDAHAYVDGGKVYFPETAYPKGTTVDGLDADAGWTISPVSYVWSGTTLGDLPGAGANPGVDTSWPGNQPKTGPGIFRVNPDGLVDNQGGREVWAGTSNLVGLFGDGLQGLDTGDGDHTYTVQAVAAASKPADAVPDAGSWATPVITGVVRYNDDRQAQVDISAAEFVGAANPYWFLFTYTPGGNADSGDDTFSVVSDNGVLITAVA